MIDFLLNAAVKVASCWSLCSGVSDRMFMGWPNGHYF